jgi:hypothetical protein
MRFARGKVVAIRSMREAESDLSFADLGGTRRLNTAPESSDSVSDIATSRIGWRAGRDSNPRPSGSKPDALSS